jgi:hypothetical protein
MNQNIKDLIDKSTTLVSYPIVNSDGKTIVDDWIAVFDKEKFAELIIQECSNINACLIGYTDMTKIDKEYTEYFGVKIND